MTTPETPTKGAPRSRFPLATLAEQTDIIRREIQGLQTMTSRPIENCYWVVPGKLLAGEYPRNLDEESSHGKLARLTGAGVSAFIDLTEEGELAPYTHWLNTASHQRFPIADMSVPDSPELTAAALDAIDQHISQGRTVYVHCWGGIGRTGTIIGCWLARDGRAGQAALENLHELWQACPKAGSRTSPETGEQEQYILNWKETL